MDSNMEIVKGEPVTIGNASLDTIDRIVETYTNGWSKPSMTITDQKTGISVSGTGRSVIRLKERLNRELDDLLNKEK